MDTLVWQLGGPKSPPARIWVTVGRIWKFVGAISALTKRKRPTITKKQQRSQTFRHKSTNMSLEAICVCLTARQGCPYRHFCRWTFWSWHRKYAVAANLGHTPLKENTWTSHPHQSLTPLPCKPAALLRSQSERYCARGVTALPVDVARRMKPERFGVLLRRRLRLPVFLCSRQCQVCGDQLDHFGVRYTAATPHACLSGVSRHGAGGKRAGPSLSGGRGYGARAETPE